MTRAVSSVLGQADAVYISTYPPRRCGLATFTEHLASAVSAASPGSASWVVALDEPGMRYKYSAAVQAVIRQDVTTDYLSAAELLNGCSRVVSLQHEFGIFGGKAGENVLLLLSRLRVPVVTTLHTILTRPEPEYDRVLREVCRLSRALVVMTHAGKRLLQDKCGVPPAKVQVIPHGTPRPVPGQRVRARKTLGLSGHFVLCTLGLLSRGKGIEYVLQALPAVIPRVPRLLYLVVGQTHPQVLRREGEGYRQSLLDLAEKLGISEHVRFVDRYLTESELIQYLLASDVYLTPYLSDQQICSGTLSYAVGMAKPIISTPYAHALELLANGTGVLVPFRDAGALSSAVLRLAHSPAIRRRLATLADTIGNAMSWPRVGHSYAHLFRSLAGSAGRYGAFAEHTPASTA